MSDYFSKLFSKTTNVEAKVSNVKKINDVDLINNGITYQNQLSPDTCKVTIDCENAQNLVIVMKYNVTKINESIYKDLDTKFKGLKEEVSKMDVHQSQKLFTTIKAYEKEYTNTKKQADTKMKGNISDMTVDQSGFKKRLSIQVIVYFKGRYGVEEKKGTVKSINLLNKTVSVEYENMKNVPEILYDIPISKLCIKTAQCNIEIGDKENQ
ncbi:MAG: hypothetical protein Terrestrivirus4_140 [Terrestrivirus sp.]|uniref:Uncharacterized protein n=1 Tax=Terrestrivirus sp. TaxID=2487775 RepID=A0A3G4ZMK9_9VIRU|nr:MAG: hypothetical protein Terrestrivirus4_140 [Terrestrivirus sp.]